MKKQIEILIKAKLEDLSKVEAVIDEMHEEGVLTDAIYGNVMVVTTEATLNAINHGSANDPSKDIKISITLVGQEVEIIVSDSGKGFDFENLPDPTDPANIDKVNGRGVFIMKNLSDKIEFLNGGSSVKITFRLESSVTVDA